MKSQTCQIFDTKMSSCVDAVNERDVKGMQIKILYTMLSYTKSFFVNGIQSNIHKENIYNEIDLVEFLILDTFSKINLGACSIHDLWFYYTIYQT